MKVKILRSTVANFQRVEEGEIVDLPQQDAELLIRLKKAVQHIPLKKRVSKVKKSDA